MSDPDRYLVVCLIAYDTYGLATRHVFDSMERAEKYARAIPVDRKPIVVEAFGIKSSIREEQD